ncbi:MAG TPA: methyltransferase domain-containing protein [Solirubrobacteraceae bacterium]|nr:methyltransferase domain-containing protein [Solirubrobacteraceae bacterium]
MTVSETRRGGPPDAVLWHDLECGAYTADLALWRELAGDPDRLGGPVLDLGAGTGRVALDLARRGHEVVALDLDETLLDALRQRVDGLAVEVVGGDARAFALGRTFALVLAPMQTVQLLDGTEGVRGLLRSARHHLRPGGVLAAALAEAIPFDTPVADGRAPAGGPAVGGRTAASMPTVEPPAPDRHEVDGWIYVSLPVAVRPDPDGGGATWLERRRETVDPTGARTWELDRVRLDALGLADLYREAIAHGFEALAPRVVAETEDHVASDVALLRREAGDG